MLNEKKVSKSGGITIPSHIRREIGITVGEKVEVKTDKEGNLVLERIEGSCIVCQTHDDLMKVDGIFVCQSCGSKILEKMKGGNES